MSTLHQLLKDSTHNLHRQLDQHLLFRSLLSPQADVKDIQRSLQFWWEFHCVAQTAIQQPQFNHRIGFLADRNKLLALKNDMRRQKTNPCSIKFQWPKVESLAELMALLYVTEGSMLGGLAIHNVLQKGSRKYPVQLEFLTVYEPNTHDNWHSFLSVLEEISSQVDTIETVLAATMWFKALTNCAEGICHQTPGTD